MKFSLAALAVSFVIILLVISLRASFAGEKTDDNIISADKVKELIDSKEDVFILDVRSEAEYNRGHIKGAYFIPVSDLIDRLSEVAKDKDVIVLCEGGMRSRSAAKQLLDRGYTRVFDMKEGMYTWREKGYPME